MMQMWRKPQTCQGVSNTRRIWMWKLGKHLEKNQMYLLNIAAHPNDIDWNTGLIKNR